MGHSMGGAQWYLLIVQCNVDDSFYSAICQPSLFTALIGIDPVIEHTAVFVHASLPAAASARRKDIWPSLAEAQNYFTSRAFYRRWDRRCLDLHIVLSRIRAIGLTAEIRFTTIALKGISS